MKKAPKGLIVSGVDKTLYRTMDAMEKGMSQNKLKSYDVNNHRFQEFLPPEIL